MKRVYVAIILPSSYGGVVLYKLTRKLIVNGITIPSGFTFDGATVPRICWSIFPPVDKYLPAVALHDYLLSRGEPWSVCNENLFKALEDTGIGAIRFNIIKLAVNVYAEYMIAFKGEK